MKKGNNIMKRFQILANYNICGQVMECLCNEPTKSGSWMFCYDEVQAQQRVAELVEKGMNARYEELPQGQAWFDNERWMG